jgi:hypothetical protein
VPKPKAAAAVIVGTVAAAVVVVVLADNNSEVRQAPVSEEVVEIYPDGLAPAPDGLDLGPVTMDPNEPLTCMVDLGCLLHEVAVAGAIVPLPPATVAPPEPAAG